jgi:hypothetical protein
MRLCRAKDLAIDGDHVEVKLKDDRHHRVSVADDADAYQLSAIVVRKARVQSLPGLPVRVWLRNRSTQLVGFRIDHRCRLVAEAWIPKIDLTAEEFQLYVRTVATECDRFEYLLTGKDVE